jgi:hypothetical protein
LLAIFIIGNFFIEKKYFLIKIRHVNLRFFSARRFVDAKIIFLALIKKKKKIVTARSVTQACN